VGSITLHGSRPQVRLRDGRKLDAGLVVGADGVRSTVRREMFGAKAGQGRALLAPASWRFMAPDPGIDCWTVWAGAEGMVLLMPVGDGEVYGWAALAASDAGAAGPERLYQLAGRFPSRVREAILSALAHPDRLHRSPLEEVRLERWHGDHAVLIGDAAHATAPVWAQGVALGLEDALVLGRLLSHGQDLEAALVEFEARRRPRVAHVQAQTDAMSRAARLPPIVRNLLLPFVGPRRYRGAYGPLKAAF
jgi:2-polyprenyl-6-methoxyphenol hydroxylase-like FAD-dependent oxidoreductase